jgi:hypothetical protein
MLSICLLIILEADLLHIVPKHLQFILKRENTNPILDDGETGKHIASENMT